MRSVPGQSKPRSSGARWFCNKKYKKVGAACQLMTAQELLEQKARQAAMLEEYRIRQLMGVSEMTAKLNGIQEQEFALKSKMLA